MNVFLLEQEYERDTNKVVGVFQDKEDVQLIVDILNGLIKEKNSLEYGDPRREIIEDRITRLDGCYYAKGYTIREMEVK